MSDDNLITRRSALLGGGALAASGVAAFLASSPSSATTLSVPFYGARQSGVTTSVQSHLVFAAFDVISTSWRELESLLMAWTEAIGPLMEGRYLSEPTNAESPARDTGEAVGLGPASLTVTVGFGPSLFDHRFDLGVRRPPALVDLPNFPGDRIDPARSHGDLGIQACANDPIVAFHAVRALTRVALGTASLRYMQFGVGATSTPDATSSTPRNLLGFKDGTNNLKTSSAIQMKEVWVQEGDGPAWMANGTYLVARRIRTHLEAWSALPLDAQQHIIGRFRASGAPLTGTREHDKLNFNQLDVLGEPVIPTSAHVRVASDTLNDGARILRRGFNFTDGVDPVTGELDAGLMFICFQRDPRRQFVTLQQSLSDRDALSDYVTATSSAIFACPPGVIDDGFLGAGLFN